MRRFMSVCATAAVIALSGCGGGSGDDSGGSMTTVQAFGKAHLETPIVGARVVLQDANGQPLAGAASTQTGASGAFSLPISAQHTPYFRVVIEGGTYQGQPFKDTLLLEVENFDTRKHLLYVNALTTLVSLHQQRTPNAQLQNSAKQVQTYLEIPPSARAAIAIDNPYQKFFSHQLLLDAVQASDASTLSAYLSRLQAEMAQGQAPRAFAKVAQAEDAAKQKADALSSILGLANGLLHNLGDEAFSGVFEAILTQMGLGGTAEILQELHEISAKLDALQHDVNKLSLSVEGAQIQTIVMQLLDNIAVIHTNYDHLTLRAHASADLPVCQLDDKGQALDAQCAAQWKELQQRTREDIAAILDPNVGVAKALKAIQLALTTTSGVEPGLFQRAFEHFKNEKPFFAPVVDPRLVKIRDYYQSAQYIGTHLLVEASMGQSSIDRSTAKFYANDLVTALEQQDAQVNASKLDNPDVVIDQTTGLIWARAPLSNLPDPFPGDVPDLYYTNQSERYCDSKARQGFAGHSTWRLPTDPEFHALVNKPDAGSPNRGDAGSGSGAFNWLIEQGFSAAPASTPPDTRSVLGLLQNNAYISSTKSGLSGDFYEALHDDGVDFVCITIHSYTCSSSFHDGHQTLHAGAWCVAEGTPTERKH